MNTRRRAGRSTREPATVCVQIMAGTDSSGDDRFRDETRGDWVVNTCARGSKQRRSARRTRCESESTTSACSKDPRDASVANIGTEGGGEAFRTRLHDGISDVAVVTHGLKGGRA